MTIRRSSVEVLVLVIFDIASSMDMLCRSYNWCFLGNYYHFPLFLENAAHMAGWQNVRVCERCALVDDDFTLRVFATRFFNVLPSCLSFSLPSQRLQRCSNDIQRLCFDSCGSSLARLPTFSAAFWTSSEMRRFDLTVLRRLIAPWWKQGGLLTQME